MFVLTYFESWNNFRNIGGERERYTRREMERWKLKREYYELKIASGRKPYSKYTRGCSLMKNEKNKIEIAKEFVLLKYFFCKQFFSTPL